MHLLTFLQVVCALLLDVFKMLEMHVGGLLESEGLAPMLRILEVTFVTEGGVVGAAVYLELVGVFAKLNLIFHLFKKIIR